MTTHNDPDPLVALLGEHQRKLDPAGSCLCGEWPSEPRDVPWTHHLVAVVRAHVATEHEAAVAALPADVAHARSAGSTYRELRDSAEAALREFRALATCTGGPGDTPCEDCRQNGGHGISTADLQAILDRADRSDTEQHREGGA